MKKVITCLALIIFLVQPLAAGKKADALNSCRQYFTNLSKLNIAGALQYADSRVYRELKKLEKAITDPVMKQKVITAMNSLKYAFFRSNVGKDRVKVFVLTYNSKGVNALRKYYLRKRKGIWKLFRYRNYPIEMHLP